MITARIFPVKRLLSRRVEWRFRFVADNNRVYGHDYDELRYAEQAVRKLISQNVGVELEVEHPDGVVERKGRIR